MQDLVFEVTGGIATIRLNRPDKKNAFTLAMLDDWHAALIECAQNDAIQTVVLTGTGDAFCAGGDVKRMQERTLDAGPIEQKDHLWTRIARIPLLLEGFDKPYLVAVNGVAAGAGMDMALMGDLVYASSSAKFVESYMRMGLIAGDGGAWYLSRLVGSRRALELLWLGDAISAERAEAIGMINAVLEPEALLDHVLAVAERLANGPKLAIRMMKRTVYQAPQSTLRAHLDQVSSHMAILKASAHHKEALAAFTERRPPRFSEVK